MATSDVSRPSPVPSKMACLKRNRAVKAAWWATAERIDALGDLISDIPYASLSGRAAIRELRLASLDLDRAIQALSAVKEIAHV